MRRMAYSRLCCLFIILTMLLLGIHAGDTGMDSSFACGSPVSSSVRIQKIDSEPFAAAIFERKALEQSRELAVERQTVRLFSGARGGQWLLTLLFAAAAFSMSFFIGTFFIQSNACRNQCRLRILEYIHHKDGKKA